MVVVSMLSISDVATLSFGESSYSITETDSNQFLSVCVTTTALEKNGIVATLSAGSNTATGSVTTQIGVYGLYKGIIIANYISFV